jgi:hypothetical protein
MSLKSRPLAGLVGEMAQQSAQTQERAREAETKVEQLESELADERETRAQEDAEIRGRLHQLEEQCKSMEGGENGTEKTDVVDETPTPRQVVHRRRRLKRP